MHASCRIVAKFEASPLGAQALSPSVAMDTFPETPVTATWGFKLRIANRNGYGNFSQDLGTGTAGTGKSGRVALGIETKRD